MNFGMDMLEPLNILKMFNLYKFSIQIHDDLQFYNY
jgi:hypothetical protein